MVLYGDGIHDDTIAIQSMLDKRGVVKIEKNGDYLITQTLKIYSNTRFELAPGVRLIAGENSHCALIQNEFFTGGGRDQNIELVGGIYDGNCDNQGINCYHLIKHRNDFPYDAHRFSGKLVRFAHIDDISLKNLTVRNPIGYGIQIGDTVGFTVDGVFFDYNWHYGCTDGVHINGPAKDGVIENL
ncbi:MAG: hypothetical protein IKC64_03130, partial [Clostridia bacterium]|nr:hypothetical protein [Clostridia bacterium]